MVPNGAKWCNCALAGGSLLCLLPPALACPADLPPPLLSCPRRLKGHFLPYNSGLLAREALSHPFFGAGRVQHGRVPEQLDAAFPPGEA